MLKKYILYHLQNVGTSILSALSLRGSFLMQAIFLFLSNLFFFSFWLIYFDQFSSLKGWNIEEMACLFGIVSGSYGIFTIFFGGARFLARIIFEGDLDSVLVRPINPLVQLLGIKSMPGGWGDIVTSIFFLSYSGYLSFETLPVILIVLASSTTLILAFSILTGSIAFWLGDSHSLGKQIFEFILTFSNYPKTIYTGIARFFLLTIIPSGFVGFLPVEVIKDPSARLLLMIVGFSSLYLVVSVLIFKRGLRNYCSGNLMGFRIS